MRFLKKPGISDYTDYGMITAIRRERDKRRLEASGIDEVANHRGNLIFVIPAPAGIQQFQINIKTVDTGFHR